MSSSLVVYVDASGAIVSAPVAGGSLVTLDEALKEPSMPPPLPPLPRRKRYPSDDSLYRYHTSGLMAAFSRAVDEMFRRT